MQLASDALESCVSPYTGIVRVIGTFLHAPDEPRGETVGCALADAAALTGGTPPSLTAGCNSRPGAARAAAIGEALERYSATFVPREAVVRASARELGRRAVAADRFALFHERQYALPGFPFGLPKRDEPIRWTRGVALPGGEPAYLPAQLAYMTPPPDDEPVLAVPTSNGLACAETWEEAVVGGLLELVERDAFMLTWYNRLSLPRLDWRGDPEVEALDARVFAPARLRYEAVDLSVFFGIPAALGVVRDPTGAEPLVGVGAAAAPTVCAAWRKALSEAFSVYRWTRDKLVEEPGCRPAAVDEIVDFDDHVLFYADHASLERLAFLDASPHVRRTPDVAPLPGDDAAARIRSICARLAARNVSAYAVDVTAPDVRAAGLTVARVLAPELCSLDVLALAPQLGGRRMAYAAHEAGLVERPLELHDLNRDPHPFP